MSCVLVSPLSKLEQRLDVSGARHLLSLTGPGREMPTPDGFDGKFLQLVFNDISTVQEGLVEPSAAHIEQIIEFGQAWDQSAPLLVHCWMGVSRSTAAAAILVASLRPQISCTHIAQAIRRVSPMATPNALMIELADTLLSRDGEFISAIAAIGRGEHCHEGIAFELPLDLEVTA